MTLRLRPLREEEFGPYVEKGKAFYASDILRSGALDRKAAEAKAEHDWAALLPDGPASANQFIFVIETSDDGERVGDLWFAARETPFEGTIAFLYMIEIEERFRGRGFGKQAMLLLEQEARARGFPKIALNVFGDNEAARSLYRSTGYAETAIWMEKRL